MTLPAWLGAADTVKDWSWRDGKSSVTEMRDDAGVSWFAKRHRHQEFFDAELEAYRRWVPALGDRAPQLRAADPEQRLLVLSSLPPASGPDWEDDEVRRDAGAALRTLHEAEPLAVIDDIQAAKQHELEQWIGCARPGTLTQDDLDHAATAMSALAGAPPIDQVPCHRDYTPRNWIVAEGRVHVLDFEEMQPDAWVVDLSRMAIGWWRDRPHLMDAVHEGYGRTPTDDELHVMRCCYAVTAIRHIVLATRFGKAEYAESVRRSLRYVRDSVF